MSNNLNFCNVIVRSAAGHDKGSLYLVKNWDTADERVPVFNGRNRTLESPKMKNRKHLQAIIHLQDDLIQHIGSITRDEDIRRVLRIYMESLSEDKNVKE